MGVTLPLFLQKVFLIGQICPLIFSLEGDYWLRFYIEIRNFSFVNGYFFIICIYFMYFLLSVFFYFFFLFADTWPAI